jgi:hypothetical protein
MERGHVLKTRKAVINFIGEVAASPCEVVDLRYSEQSDRWNATVTCVPDCTEHVPPNTVRNEDCGLEVSDSLLCGFGEVGDSVVSGFLVARY